MRACRNVRSRLFDAFEHELGIEETLAIEAHLAECTRCAEEARRLRVVHEELARAGDVPIERVDVERNVRAIRAALDRPTRTTSPSRTVVWLAAAAGIAGVLLWARFGGSREPESALEFSIATVPTGLSPRAEGPSPVALEAVPAAEPQESPLAPKPLAPLDPIDTQRLLETRRTVREALLAARAPLDQGDVAGFVERMDAGVSELVRERWPVARLVERFADDPEVAPAALCWLGRRGDALALRTLENGLLDPRLRDAAAAALVDALGERDPDALAAALVRAVRARPRALEARFALDLVAREGLATALPWVEDWARERSARGDEAAVDSALAVAAGFEDPAGLRSLLRLRAGGRIGEDALRKAFEAHFTRTAGPALEIARDRSTARRGEELRQLEEVLREHARPALVPVWIELAAAKELSVGDRRFAILLAGEFGRAEHVGALTELLGRVERNLRDLKAAVLIAIHSIGGEAALEDVLAQTPRESRNRILELFRKSGGVPKPETKLLELARALESLITPLQL